MILKFLHSFHSEWLKTKRSVASWLVMIGGFFIPFTILIAHILKEHNKPVHAPPKDFWLMIFSECWNPMAIFLMPMGIILTTSLVAQLEFKNNTWKQVFVMPQKISTIFVAKYTVILVMLFQFFFFFNVGIIFIGIFGSMIIFHIPYPHETFPLISILKQNAAYYLDCLPIVALQYLLSIRYRNFLVSVGIGFLLEVITFFAYSFKYGYIHPYSYCGFYYFEQINNRLKVPTGINIHLLAISYFIVFSIINYFLFIRQKERG